MENIDGNYYIRPINSITKTISFVTFIHARFDIRHGFHLNFVNEHICVLSVMKSNVQTVYHFTKENQGGR